MPFPLLFEGYIPGLIQADVLDEAEACTADSTSSLVLSGRCSFSVFSKIEHISVDGIAETTFCSLQDLWSPRSQRANYRSTPVRVEPEGMIQNWYSTPSSITSIEKSRSMGLPSATLDNLMLCDRTPAKRFQSGSGSQPSRIEPSMQSAS